MSRRFRSGLLGLGAATMLAAAGCSNTPPSPEAQEKESLDKAQVVEPTLDIVEPTPSPSPSPSPSAGARKNSKKTKN